MAAPEGIDADEWRLLRLSPWLVALTVMASDRSGTSGAGAEIAALLAGVRWTDEHGSDSDLVRAVSRALVDDTADTSSAPMLPEGDGSRAAALALLGKVADVVEDRGVPGEAVAFGQWLLDLGRKVAEAAKEGGFLGFGGVAVSHDEEQVLAEMAVALRVGA